MDSSGFLYDSWDIGIDLYYSLYMGLCWRWTDLYPFFLPLVSIKTYIKDRWELPRQSENSISEDR